MRTFPSIPVAEQPGPSNRRQPVRQTRNNPAKTSNTATLTAGMPADGQDVTIEEAPGFFPAITHFTDAITQLPKEMIRHYQMLKEVDAKTFGPEEKLGQLLNAGLRAPVPKPANSSAETEPLPEPNLPESRHPRFSRRNHFLEMRREMHGLLMTLDEKNHVMNCAIDGLEKQLQRCQSSFPYIEDEISEEARLGSMAHWAYNTEKPTEKKGIIAGERTRRAANNLAATEGDGVAVRSETKREALSVRKGRGHNVDSDFDDSKPHGKKVQNGAKGRKIVEPPYGLGISNATAPPNKRRKVEPQGAGGTVMARTMSSTYGTNTRGTPPAADGKKKSRGGAVAPPNGRRRNNTNTSAANSPNLASSPIVGTFASSTKDRQRPSPAPSLLQRVPSSRGHQQSASQSSRMQLSRNRSSSTTVQRATNGALHHTTTIMGDIEKLSGLTGKTHTDVRANMKETVNTKGEHMIEDSTDGAAEMRGALVVDRRDSDTRPNNTPNGRTRSERPPSISVSTRGGGNGNGISHSKNPSKTASPLARSFTADSMTSRARPSRAAGGADLPTTKRSHKKGAGIAAQMAAAAAAAAAAKDDDGDVSMQEDELRGEDVEIEEPEGEGGEEPRYCYCNDFSYGEMVGCDADDCPREWFHLHCVGLNKAPAKTAKWYCDECKENLRRR